MDFVASSLAVWASFRRLPTWVQAWVWILIATNAASFALLDTEPGRWTAAAAAFVVLTNVPIMYAYRGMNKLMSVPHLIVWIPLLVWLSLWLVEAVTGAHQARNVSTTAFGYAVLVVVINGTSIIFDLKDSWEWIRGDRETP